METLKLEEKNPKPLTLQLYRYTIAEVKSKRTQS